MVYIRSDVLYSKEEEWLCILHKEKRSTKEQYSVKTASEEVWVCNSQPGNQVVFHIMLMVPLDANEYNDVIIYSVFL